MRPALRLAGLTAAVLAASLLAPAPAVTAGAPPLPATDEQGAAGQPNIVVVQLDDVSLNLMQTMSQARRMGREGVRFTNSFVVDSLCCPSRAAFFLGRNPRHTGVRTNTQGPDKGSPTGGWQAFDTPGNLADTFHARLDDDYATGFVGKYLNGYSRDVYERQGPVDGWDRFVPVFASGYRGWDFEYGGRKDGELAAVRVKKLPGSASRRKKDQRYVQTFIENRALRFIGRHERGGQPYLYVVSPYAAHSRVGGKAYPNDPPFPPAFQDRPRPERPQGNCGLVACRTLDVRTGDAWNDSREDNRPQRLVDGRVVPARHWRPARPTESAASLTAKYRQRAQMLQSVDRTLRRILDRVGDDTYVVLTSDNGYHLGQYQLDGGKGTPYQTDTRVPLYVVGPGVPAGQTRTQQVTNLDLAPTFESLAGLTVSAPYRDGVSFADQLTAGDATAPGGRFTYFEHTRDRRNGPDGEAEGDARLAYVPSYVAVRSARGLLVRLDLDPDPGPGPVRYAWELYDYASGFEDTNVFRRDHREEWVQDLMRRIRDWSTCEEACGALTR